jgi:hypothetical protein
MMPFMGASKPISSGIEVGPSVDPGKKVCIEMFGKPPATGSAIFEGGISPVTDYVKKTAICASYLI